MPAAIPRELTDLHGVGPALAEKLARLGVRQPADLLFLLPQRYEDRTRLTPIGAVVPGSRVVVAGEVALAEIVFRRRRSLLCRIGDGTGMITLRFFYFSKAQQEQLARGRRVLCFGEARSGPGGMEMVHPEYQFLGADEQLTLEQALTPVYPSTEGLQQFRLRALATQALERYLPLLPDWLEGRLPDGNAMPGLHEALRTLHRPPPGVDLARLAAGRHPAQRRLALEEMLAHHLSLRRLRERARQDAALPLPARDGLRERFLAGLGFELTTGQREALAAIDADLMQPQPMLRLVQGDVGCGKTVVAAAAALRAVENGHQVAVMAPTELLTEQHRRSFTRWLAPLGIEPVWLSGSLGRRERQHALEAIGSGRGQVVIGTHALFQEGVTYRSLALMIVDEQHRFGVHQRLALMQKGAAGSQRPHQLVMTATPIPRTLAMTLYADLDSSVIRELPPGRQPVQTIALPDRRRAEVVARVREAASAGHRAYWVCPLIEDSAELDYQAAESTHEMLAAALPGLAVGLVHGRMKPEDKDTVMREFAAGTLQVLVATTVIEVGVDVPEATLMIIENAERMGLAQLHQLRGRVGRGAAASHCVLLYQLPLQGMARERLQVMRETNDGFVVAQKDLELRGPGEVLGTRQTGLTQLRVADLLRDADLAPWVQRLGQEVLARNPELAEPLIHRWIGEADRYGAV
ncbi:ATP-dependent DNA helicase RecG [Gammaproteobacteria bacterium]|nr:ATP-dependent DNA helicase RecG [Gammaproteobacteria bacterium]CAG0944259.1 ATP-dependent DNA helicase RecG [Gammaproteobacteria bacterium]